MMVEESHLEEIALKSPSLNHVVSLVTPGYKQNENTLACPKVQTKTINKFVTFDRLTIDRNGSEMTIVNKITSVVSSMQLMPWLTAMSNLHRYGSEHTLGRIYTLNTNGLKVLAQTYTLVVLGSVLQNLPL